MRLSWQSGLLAALLALGFAALAGIAAPTADDKKPAGKAEAEKVPFVGNWKVTVVFNTTLENTSFIIKIADKDGKPDVTTAWVSPELKDLKVAIEDAKVDAKAVRFTFAIGDNARWAMNAYPPKGAKDTNVLLGTAKAGSQMVPLGLEKTDDTEVALKDIQKVTPGAEDYQKAAMETDDKKKAAALKEILEKFENKPITVPVAGAWFQEVAKHADKDEEVVAGLKQYVKVLNTFGPEMEEQATAKIASALMRSDKAAALTLEYARKVEKSLDKDAPPAKQVSVMKLVAKALRKNKKDDEAKTLEEKAAKIDKELDEEFEKTAIPFEPDAFKGRKAASHRIAVVELFTGAHCPPCVAADVAFDAALKTFKPKDVVFLEYHLHIPRPDPLTNGDTEAREKFYGDEVQGTPSAFVNGKATEPLGGRKQGGKDSYDTLRKTIEDVLETAAPADIQVKAKRTGDKIEADVRVIDLKKPDDKLRLHLVLVEDVVRYPGSNGQRLHHHVVRAFPGGTEGVAVKEGTSQNKLTIDLAEVSKNLVTFLDESEKKRPFLDDERPTTFGNLKLIAFIQDNDTKEIKQAGQADVPEAK
jgi:hypothetical protein